MLLGCQLEVLASEGNDPRIGCEPGRGGDPIGIQPRASDHRIDRDASGRGRDADARRAAAAHRFSTLEGNTEAQLPACRHDVIGERAAYPWVVDDPRRLDIQRPHTSDVGLMFAGLLGREQLRRNTVGVRALGERGQAGNLGLVAGHDELAAVVVSDALLTRIGIHRGRPSDCHPRFEAAGGVIESGVHDAGVAAGLVLSQRRLLLQDDDLLATQGQRPRRRQADDSATDDRDRAHSMEPMPRRRRCR